MEALFSALIPLVGYLSSTYPVLLSFLALLGTARLFVKPVMSLVRAYVSFSSTKEDDKALSKIENHKVTKVVIYILDWLLSIKLKK